MLSLCHQLAPQHDIDQVIHRGSSWMCSVLLTRPYSLGQPVLEVSPSSDPQDCGIGRGLPSLGRGDKAEFQWQWSGLVHWVPGQLPSPRRLHLVSVITSYLLLQNGSSKGLGSLSHPTTTPACLWVLGRERVSTCISLVKLILKYAIHFDALYLDLFFKFPFYITRCSCIEMQLDFVSCYFARFIYLF